MTRTERRLVVLSTVVAILVAVAAVGIGGLRGQASRKDGFHLEEATIAQIQRALVAKDVTTVEIVNRYLARIKAYNGTCVSQPDGILGSIEPIPHAGQINALITLNLRPAVRKTWGFDDRKARSLTDASDSDSAMPDALEVAAAQDLQLAKTGRLVGPLHGVVMSIKDVYDTRDMRTTGGADVEYANDRPPDDATFVKRLRAAGAIILAKANLGDRSAFGGTPCNPYDTERSPSTSSSGSATSVAANLVTCSIGEETGISIRSPARASSVVGISPTQELVSRDGMSGAGLNTRVGPICRTVEDAARVLTVIAGYDPKDPLTAFSVGRTPAQAYETFAHEQRLDGMRIGVVREYMNKELFSKTDEETIDIVDRALGDLHRLGATIVDPGPEGMLFQGCIRQYGPQALNVLFTRQYPDLFPIDAHGKPTSDHVSTLVEMALEPDRVPNTITVRDIEPVSAPTATGSGRPAEGESKYMRLLYLRQRGDAAIRTSQDQAKRSHAVRDPKFRSARGGQVTGEPMELDMSERILQRFGLQQVVLSCMADLRLDAVTYPTINVPPLKIGAPAEPLANARGIWTWSLLGQQGLPAISVPAGFTTHVYDRVADPATPDRPRLVGPTPAALPVGIDFLGRPFDEATILRIASAYERATRHRTSPVDFGPLAH